MPFSAMTGRVTTRPLPRTCGPRPWPSLHETSRTNPDPKKQSRYLRVWTPYDRSYRHFDLQPAIILELSCRFTVNPVPRTYVRGFRACASGTSEHSSLHLRTGRSVVRGKSISLARPDAHQGLFHEQNNFGSGLTIALLLNSLHRNILGS